MPARSTRHASRPKKLSPPVAPDSAECSQTCDPIPLDVCEMLLAQAITDYEGSDLYANSAASPSRAGSSAGRSSAQWSDPGVSYTGQDTWLEPAYDYVSCQGQLLSTRGGTDYNSRHSPSMPTLLE